MDKKIIVAVTAVILITVVIAVSVFQTKGSKSNITITPGTQVLITQTQEVTSTEASANEPQATVPEYSYPQDLNKITLEGLCGIRGIGGATAQKILDLRTALGKYRSVDELKNIDGIGDKTVGYLRNYLYVVNEETVPKTSSTTKPLATSKTAVQKVTKQPSVSSKKATNTIPNETAPFSNVVNINTADRQQLMEIPGMTDEKADSILDLRDKIGTFSDIHELLMSDKISREFLRGIEKYICV